MWKDLKTPPNVLRLSMVLPTGQMFTWKHTKSDTWVGVVRSLIFELLETPSTIKYRVLNINDEINSNYNEESIHSILYNFFNLQTDQLAVLDSFKDKRIIELYNKYEGLRVLQQDPLECIFSFICSANNNIKRITKMVESLKAEAGKFLGHGCYQFPDLESLARLEPERLRRMGFGFRSPRIPTAAKQIIERGGIEWVDKLKTLPLSQCRRELTELSGVGPKIADCICLYSLGFMSCIPLDVHMLVVAKKYVPSTIKGYKNIQIYLEKMIGPYGGWAQCLLFLEQLKTNNRIKEIKA